MSKAIDLTGQKFGKLTVIRREGTKNNKAMWRCKCDCPDGNEVIVSSTHLRSGHTKSCGCYKFEVLRNTADDLTGQKFGRWTVLERVGRTNSNEIMWKCQCSCEKKTIKDIAAHSLKSENSTSCGCYASELKSERRKINYKPRPIINMVGERYGKLTVKRMLDRKPKEKTYWYCSCECGGNKITTRSRLKSGKDVDCGCTKEISYRKTYPRICRIWGDMKQRCYNSNYDRYNDYGGRGITVCNEWRDSLKSFVDWSLENGYADGLSIDRIDNNKGYSPDNCRWITMFEQMSNTRKNRNIEYNGETKTLSQWCREYNLCFSTVAYRLKVGYSVEQAFFGLPNDQYKKVKRK